MDQMAARLSYIFNKIELQAAETRSYSGRGSPVLNSHFLASFRFSQIWFRGIAKPI